MFKNVSHVEMFEGSGGQRDVVIVIVVLLVPDES
jgi:hypothetical protein